MAIEATTPVDTSPIATVAPKEVTKTVETKAPAATTTSAAAAAPVTGDSVAKATPTEAQAKKVDVTA